MVIDRFCKSISADDVEKEQQIEAQRRVIGFQQERIKELERQQPRQTVLVDQQ